jgi:agmatinase
MPYNSDMSSLSALERLRAFLRPPGKGIWTQSTGGGYASILLKLLYGTDNPKEVGEAWEEGLQRLRRIDTVLLGIPSDTGAGIMRGANFGPIGVREAYLSLFGQFPKSLVDIGDVIVVPQLLHDSMHSDSQIQATRASLYPGMGGTLPVSPLSIAEAVFDALLELNPNLRVFVIGGDHSVSFPSMHFCHKRTGGDFGVLHIDAHTDLLEQRLGVKYCFGTWASHAVKQMKPQHFVQVGIRTSSKPKEHWEQSYPIRQFWANEILGREGKALEDIVQHFKSRKIRNLFISNDIDGTDSKEAPATGTPEGNGLHATFVKQLIQAVKNEFTLLGSDIVEVAPPLSGRTDFAGEPTCRLAADYLHSLL